MTEVAAHPHRKLRRDIDMVPFSLLDNEFMLLPARNGIAPARETSGKLLPHHSIAPALWFARRRVGRRASSRENSVAPKEKKSGGYPVTAYPPGKITWVK
jgi:hypothetical protein